MYIYHFKFFFISNMIALENPDRRTAAVAKILCKMTCRTYMLYRNVTCIYITVLCDNIFFFELPRLLERYYKFFSVSMSVFCYNNFLSLICVRYFVLTKQMHSRTWFENFIFCFALHTKIIFVSKFFSTPASSGIA